MLDLKPYGAFIENTIRPMIEEAQTLLSDLHGYGLYLDKEDVFRMAKIVASNHFKAVLIQAICNVIICSIICFTIYKTGLWKI